MKILKYIMRQTQQSIVCEEQSEYVTIFQVEYGAGSIGSVVGYHTLYKRDADSDWYATTKELAKVLKDNSDDLVKLNEKTWGNLEPMFTSPTEWTKVIQREAAANRILCTQ